MTETRSVPPMKDAIAQHLEECDPCLHDAPVLAQAAAILSASTNEDIPVVNALPLLQSEIRRQARASLGRRVAFVVSIGAIPLPIVIGYNVLVLRVAYEFVRRVLPAEMAAYLVLSYGALSLLLIALAYASIPFLVAGRRRTRDPVDLGAMG